MTRNERHQLHDLVRQVLGPEASGVSRVERRERARTRLARVKEHLHRNALFAISADEIDTLAVQQAQWEATAYAAADRILREAEYRGRHHELAPCLDELRPVLWPEVEGWVDGHCPALDDEKRYRLVDSSFSWARENARSMPATLPAVRRWLRDGVRVVIEGARQGGGGLLRAG